MAIVGGLTAWTVTVDQESVPSKPLVTAVPVPVPPLGGPQVAHENLAVTVYAGSDPAVTSPATTVVVNVHESTSPGLTAAFTCCRVLGELRLMVEYFALFGYT